MTTIPEIHISDVRAFRACRRRWDWSSMLRRGLEPYIVYAPFFTGRAIHESLEDYHGGKKELLEAFDEYVVRERRAMTDLGSLWPEEERTLDEQIQLARELLEHYLLWQAYTDHKYADKNFDFLELEYEWTCPAPLPNSNLATGRFEYGGKFDGIVYNRVTDEYWVWETKTTRSIDSLINTLATDEQSALYLYAAKQIFDFPITGVLYNMIRKKPPTAPRLLSNGLFSKARSIDTTDFHYKSVVQKEFPDWTDETINQFFGDILDDLRPNEYKFFLRYPVYKSEKEIASTLEGIYYTGMEMTDPTTKIYPSPGWMTCNFCNFKSPCLAMNAGSDYEVLLQEEYRPRLGRDER